MNRQYVEQVVGDYLTGRQQSVENRDSLLEAAMFLEDVFHVHLLDRDICRERLGTSAAMVRLVLERLGSA